MKRVLIGVCLLALAACSENPTQPVVASHPQFATVIGSGATWYFEGHVLYNWNSGQANEGDIVKGTAKFTITSADLYGYPCEPIEAADVVFTYSVNGQTYTITHSGQVISMMDCQENVEGPRVQINANWGSPLVWGGTLEVYNPSNSYDFPLTPPPLGEWPRVFQAWNYETGTGFMVYLDVLRLNNPTSKNDCKNDGFKKFNFRNQGLCVSFIETGKDSR